MLIIKQKQQHGCNDRTEQGRCRCHVSADDREKKLPPQAAFFMPLLPTDH